MGWCRLNKGYRVRSLSTIVRLLFSLLLGRYEAVDSVRVMPGAPPTAEQELKGNLFFKQSCTPAALVLRVGAQV